MYFTLSQWIVIYLLCGASNALMAYVEVGFYMHKQSPTSKLFTMTSMTLIWLPYLLYQLYKLKDQ